MPKLSTKINPDSPAFRDNAVHMRALVDDLREKVGVISRGGSDRARVNTSRAESFSPESGLSVCLIQGRRSSSCLNLQPMTSIQKRFMPRV